MADKVFVNGRSAIHAGSSGQSTAFPDVNLCPPGPPAGPIPVPLPNNARAADLQGGASSVLIEGTPMAKKSSYFAKSTGNEIARSTGGGVVSHVAQGKAYFASYSMDVTVEGEEVPRHLDLMTHNHAGPQPPNAAMGTYLGSMSPEAILPAKPAKTAAEKKKSQTGSYEMFLGFVGDRADDHVDSYELRSHDGRYKQVIAASAGQRQADALSIKFQNLRPGKRYSLYRLVNGDAKHRMAIFEGVPYADLLQDARTPPKPLAGTPKPARAPKPTRPSPSDPLLAAEEIKAGDDWYWAHHAPADDDQNDGGR